MDGWQGDFVPCAGPSMQLNPGTAAGEVAALARRLAVLAEAVEAARLRLLGAAALDWQSKAAEAFRQESGRLAGDLHAVSSGVRDASAGVEAYARALEALAVPGSGG